MKQHLSHCPHQCPSRSDLSRWKARLQLRNDPWYRSSPAKTSAIHNSVLSRSMEK